MILKLFNLKCLIVILALLGPGRNPGIGAEVNADNLQSAFRAGEQFDYNVYFEFIQGGSARMAVEDVVNINGHNCYHIVSTARSTKAVDMFYKVRDRIETWRDLKGGFSRRYSKKLREGSYGCDKLVEYYPDSSMAFYYRNLDAEAETLEVLGNIQDVLSAFYDVRTQPLEVGKSIFIDLHDIDKRYKLEVAVLDKEKVEVPAGTFDCFVVEPRLQSSGLFRREGNIVIWLSDDENRIPVLMKSKLYFGRVWAKLTSFQLGEQ